MGRASPEPSAGEGRSSAIGTPQSCGLPTAAAAVLEQAGFVVAGVLDVRAYDALVPTAWRSDAWMPEARSALVLGTGGGRFETRWRVALAGALAASRDPIDTFTRRVLQEFVDVLERADDTSGAARRPPAARFQLYCDRRADGAGGAVFADFVGLARACGLGAPSRLGLLLHPRFGPWWSVRALVLTRAPLRPSTTGATPGFDPCAGCAAPCERACPVAAVAPAGFDVAACAGHRIVSPACAVGCAARRACPVGRAYAFAADDEATYAAASLAWIRSGPACD